MIDIALRRQFFADEIEAVANLRTARLRDALASVPREQFLGPGPWTVHGEYSGARLTASADPTHVYHNYSVAIDPARQLFNGMPSFVTGVIDQLGLAEGSPVLHVGAGLGDYTPHKAAVVGTTGQVVATEI
jgi:protein-L-isoaspartate(D-aspartate) O-methyltransferase